ncbi:MAG: glucokinase [Syntrophotaleaceae bacterium]
MKKCILAGDIGGTKTLLAVFTEESGMDAPLAEATFVSRDYSSLEILVRKFLLESGLKLDRACFGVPGPVIGGRARATNLPWILDESRLARSFGFSSVTLLNDLVACAHAIPFLKPEDLDTINPGHAVTGGAKVVVAPGTGLGEAYLTWDGTSYLAHPSEGGHADFAPTTPLESALLTEMQKKFDHVSYERVCSGSGVPNIYNFLRDRGYAEEPRWLKEELAAAEDPVAVIFNKALSGDPPNPLCSLTMDTLVGILGSEAGNAALKLMATGGVYLGGGLSPRLLPAMKKSTFMTAFRRKGRMSQLMADIPVKVILNSRTALLGAARCGLSKEECPPENGTT